MIRPENETEDLFLSITKNCETHVKQNHRKTEETLEFKFSQPRETYSSKPPISIEAFRTLGLTSLEVYNSISNITHGNNKFELFLDTFDKFSFEKLKNQLEGIPNFSNITPELLQDEQTAERKVSTYKKLETEKRGTDVFYMPLLGYARSPFRDFESRLRSVVGLDEDDIWLERKQCNSNFVTCEIPPGIHSVKDISEVVYTMGDHEGILKMEYEDIQVKTRLAL